MSFSKLGNAAHRSPAISVLVSLKSSSSAAAFFSLWPSRSSRLVLIMETFTVSRAL